MAELFAVSELVRVAVEDEKVGVAFYSALAGAAKDPGLKETFAKLTDEERRHQKRFEEMLRSVGRYAAPERYPDEYGAYLQATTSDRAFPDEDAARKQAEQCTSDREAVDFALGLERNTLLLLNEMRKFTREKDTSLVDEIASEEQSHLVTLLAARRRLPG